MKAYQAWPWLAVAAFLREMNTSVKCEEKEGLQRREAYGLLQCMLKIISF